MYSLDFCNILKTLRYLSLMFLITVFISDIFSTNLFNCFVNILKRVKRIVAFLNMYKTPKVEVYKDMYVNSVVIALCSDDGWSLQKLLTEENRKFVRLKF